MNSKFTSLVRVLLGLVLLVFGLNKFYPLPFLPTPQLPEQAADFMGSLAATGYVLPIIGILEIFIALLLFTKNWIAFALILLVPISLNILLFHLFLDIPSIGGAILVAVLNGILIYKHWPQYRPLFN
ncbi:DoxX protein [Flavobacterium microcysteis]